MVVSRRIAALELLTGEEHRLFENIRGDEATTAWPEVGSRMMTHVITGQDLRDGWVIVQDGVYRYGVAHSSGLLVRSVLFEYLATEVWWADSP